MCVCARALLCLRVSVVLYFIVPINKRNLLRPHFAGHRVAGNLLFSKERLRVFFVLANVHVLVSVCVCARARACGSGCLTRGPEPDAVAAVAAAGVALPPRAAAVHPRPEHVHLPRLGRERT